MEITYAQLESFKGAELGPSEYRLITQEDINTFADLTNDHYWIHVDPERAAASPLGGTIVHGYLTLALISEFWPKLLWVTDTPLMVNYGFDRVRFTAPVRSGTRVRMRSKIVDIIPTATGSRLKVEQVIERENEAKPAIVATCLFDIARPTDGPAGE
jgi:Acyl dehydratase